MNGSIMNGALARLLVTSVWLDRPRFEEAETKSEEMIAREHSGLKVEGKKVPEAQVSSDIAGIIGAARSMIEEGLRVTPTKSAASSDQDKSRVAQLEKENRALKDRVAELESFIKSKGLNLPGTTNAPAKKNEETNDDDDDDDDDFDPFASEDEEEAAAAKKLKEERLAAYAEKKSKKPAIVAKSSIILDVKPWDDETDMKELERLVRNVKADGLEWKGSELKVIAYGIKKLQIICVVEDDKVGTDFLEEEICALEDLVQSVDIVAFNKL